MSLIIRYGPPLVVTVDHEGNTTSGDTDLTKTKIYDILGTPSPENVDDFSSKLWVKALKKNFGNMLVGMTNEKIVDSTKVGDYRFLSSHIRRITHTPSGVHYEDFYKNFLADVEHEKK